MEITPLVRHTFLKVGTDEKISEMIGKLKYSGDKSALVFKDNKYLGTIAKKKLLKSRLDAAEAKVKTYLARAPLLNEYADVVETAYLMFESGMDCLPVEQNKSVIGVLRALDVVQLGVNLAETKGWKVEDIKLAKPRILSKDEAIATAIDLMHDEHIDHVPVFDKGKLYGIISYLDILEKYLNWVPRRDISTRFDKSRGAEPEVKHLASLPVEDFCTSTNLVVTSRSASLQEAVRLMVKSNVSCLPVMEDSKIQGLLTMKNLLRALASLKIPQKFNIRFVGLQSLGLDEYEKYAVQKIAANESFKLQRSIPSEFQLVLLFKAYNKFGTRRKYSVNLKVEYPGKLLTSSQDDWDVVTALRKTFNSAKNEAGSKFRGKERRRVFPE